MTLLLALLLTTSAGPTVHPHLTQLDTSNHPGWSTQAADDLVSITLRLSPDVDLQRINSKLASLGGEVSRRPNGATRKIGHIISATLPREALETIKGFPEIIHIEPSLPIDLWAPTEFTANSTGATSMWNRGPAAENRLLGQGIRIMSIDKGADIFHPAMFQADGGAYPWHDTNQNLIFEPGIDQIEYATNSPVIIDSIDTSGWYFDVPTDEWKREHQGGDFDPRRDWLFIDSNQNSLRDYGTTNGFTEDTPAYGEPLFIPDDANNNGVLDPGERLLLLNSSKIERIRESSIEYVRGTNLITYPSIATDLSHHGTAVAGIINGGQNPGRRAYVGLAPMADLMIWSYAASTTESFVDAIDWGVEHNAQIHLHEWSSWVGNYMDGSSNLEIAMDEASLIGSVQISPAGNLATSNKHSSGSVPAESTLSFDIEIPPDFLVLVLDIRWLEPTIDLSFTITNPEGRTFEPTLNGEQATPFNALAAWSDQWESPRDTTLAELWLYSNSDVPIGSGTWQLNIDNPSPTPVAIDLMLSDYTGWGNGIEWASPDPNGTLCYNASADTSLVVGAHGGRFLDSYGADVGDLREWSSRGPRIDGLKTVDLTAPDDALSAYPNEEEFGQYRQFGGTSGAGAHVAAIAALLLQAEPELSSLELKERLRTSATPTPNHTEDEVGQGAIDGWRALENGQDPPTSLSPIDARLTLRFEELPDGLCRAFMSLEDAYKHLESRLDIHYDGGWDTLWSLEEQHIDVAPGETLRIRYDLTDHGALAGGGVWSGQVPLVCPNPFAKEAITAGCNCRVMTRPPPGLSWLLLGTLCLLRRRTTVVVGPSSQS